MCVAEDSTDLTFVKTSMATVLQMNTKLALEGIFDQIMGEDETIRQKGLEYVCATLMTMKNKLFDSHSENEEVLFNLIKKVCLTPFQCMTIAMYGMWSSEVWM